LVSYAPARNKTINLLSSQHHGETCMDEEIYLKPEITMQCNATKSRADNLDKLLKEYIHIISGRCWLALETATQLDCCFFHNIFFTVDGKIS
jgi:hypothetical protein